jgi:hypothetical protein
MTTFTIILAIVGLVEALSHHRQMAQLPPAGKPNIQQR